MALRFFQFILSLLLAKQISLGEFICFYVCGAGREKTNFF